MKQFNNDGFCDFQMSRLFGHAVQAVDISNAKKELKGKIAPIVWGMSNDDPRESFASFQNFSEFTRNGLISELRIGKGRVIICSLWLLDGIKRGYPEAGYLLDCLIDYAYSPEFQPAVEPLSLDEAKLLLKVGK